MTHLRSAVIDTSALISALVSNYDFSRDQRRGGRLILTDGLKDPLHIETERRRYLDLLASISKKLVTSHVLVEAYRLRDFSGVIRDNFRSVSTDLLMQWDIMEEHVPLADICKSPGLRQCIPRLGLTDVALICLAQRRNCELITEDEPLYREAPRFGVRCVLVRNLMSPA